MENVTRQQILNETSNNMTCFARSVPSFEISVRVFQLLLFGAATLDKSVGTLFKVFDLLSLAISMLRKFDDPY